LADRLRMKRLAIVPLFVIGCTTLDSSESVELGEPGRLAIAGNCVIVAERSSLVCVPRAGDEEPRTLVTLPAREYVAAVGDDDGVFATSIDGAKVFVDRVSLDGRVRPVIATAATLGAGELALADRQLVLSTGSELLLAERDGSIVTTLADADGVIGAVAVRAGRVYYADDAYQHVIDLAGKHISDEPYLQTLALAADAVAAFAAHRLEGDTAFSFVDNETTGDSCELYGTVLRVAVAGGQPYALTDTGIFDASEVVARDALAEVSNGVDVIADAQHVYWITRTGALARIAR
jgi:hypothetical protein